MVEMVEYVDADEEETDNPNIFLGMVKILFGILFVGILIGAIIYSMNTLKTELEKVDIDFSETSQYKNIQEIFGVYLYPILGLTNFLAILCHIYIIFLAIGFWIMAYKIGTKPVYLGLSIIFLILSTWLGTIISNYYVDMMDIDVMPLLVADLTYYNFFMSNFPWFVFLIGLVGIIISLVNFQKPSVNTIQEEDLYE